MSEERMMILSMLENGSISNEEALKLLEALDEVETKEDDEQIKQSINLKKDTDEDDFDIDEDKKEDLNDFGKQFEDLGKKLEKQVGENLKDFKIDVDLGDLGHKLGQKMGKLGTDISEGTMSFTDKLFKGINKLVENGNFNMGNLERFEETIVKEINEIPVSKICFNAINGKIELIESEDDEQLKVKVHANIRHGSLKEGESLYNVFSEDDSLVFDPKIKENIGINLRVYIPEQKFDYISLNTTNGKIQINNLNLIDVSCNTKNSSIVLEDISCRNIFGSTKNSSITLKDTHGVGAVLKTSNASLNLEDIEFDNLDVTTSNGSVKLSDLSCKEIDINTSNGKVIVEDISLDKLRKLHASTSNAQVKFYPHDLENRPIKINASTSFGKIDVDVDGLVYELNKKQELGSKAIMAYTKNYEDSEEFTDVVLKTSNGNISIG